MMVISGPELVMSRRQISAMIDADPIQISLTRKVRVTTPAGGWTWGAPITLAPQKCRLIPFSRRQTEFLLNTEAGFIPELPYILLGFHTMDIQRDDTFTWNGDKFQVVTMDIGEPEVKSLYQVDYWGGENND